MWLFVFKQKTAYEMRISDWSSDVCSSDLSPAGAADATARLLLPPRIAGRPRANRSRLRRLQAAAGGQPRRPGRRTLLAREPADRKSAVSGKSVSVLVDPGGRRIINKKNTNTTYSNTVVRRM